jgi:hypothetical protein
MTTMTAPTSTTPRFAGWHKEFDARLEAYRSARGAIRYVPTPPGGPGDVEDLLRFRRHYGVADRPFTDEQLAALPMPSLDAIEAQAVRQALRQVEDLLRQLASEGAPGLIPKAGLSFGETVSGFANHTLIRVRDLPHGHAARRVADTMECIHLGCGLGGAPEGPALAFLTVEREYWYSHGGSAGKRRSFFDWYTPAMIRDATATIRDSLLERQEMQRVANEREMERLQRIAEYEASVQGQIDKIKDTLASQQMQRAARP